MRKRIDLASGSRILIEEWGPYLGLTVSQRYSQNFEADVFALLQDREEAIALADALLNAVRAQDEARRAAGGDGLDAART